MKIAVVTGTRAEYGLLSRLMRGIANSLKLELQVLVTGAHLLPEFGLTVEEIVGDGFAIDRRISEVSSASDGIEVARQVGAGTTAFAEAFVDLKPATVVMLGDRYELLAAASAAFFLNIPIVHLHGGEVTQGAFDDAIRHTISQFARIHAVAAPEYGNRLVRAGAHPDSVHVVGGLGVDAVHSREKLTRGVLEQELGLRIVDPLLLVTYHPVTLAHHNTGREIESLLDALSAFSDATVVFTMPNTDPEHQTIVEALEAEVTRHSNWHLFSSLGSTRYLSLLALASAVVGNSSSGLMEAPALGVPTVNIGPRQDGRLLASSVISCDADTEEIQQAIRKVLTPQFRISSYQAESQYGTPGATERVLALLESIPFDTLGERRYYDVPETN